MYSNYSPSTKQTYLGEVLPAAETLKHNLASLQEELEYALNEIINLKSKLALATCGIDRRRIQIQEYMSAIDKLEGR